MGNCFVSSTVEADEKQNEVNIDSKNKREPLDITVYKIGKTLGSGASCRVVEASDKRDPNHKVAIKIIEKNQNGMNKLFAQEVNILSRLCPAESKDSYNKHILQFEGYAETDNSMYVVTKMLEGGELFDRIVSHDEKYVITEKQAALLIRDMLTAVKYCHDHQIVHRDLKPENFVFATKEVDSDIVLIDFGCALVVNDDDINEEIVGTAYYLAPELACAALHEYYKQGKTSSVMNSIPKPQPRTGRMLRATDVWSMGVIAYVIMTGKAPFRGQGNQGIFESICVNKLTFPEKDARYHTQLQLSDSFKDFITKTLVKDPKDRISIEEAIRHPWVQGISTTDYRLNKDVIYYLRQFHYQSKLKKQIVRVLASNMTKEPEQEVRKHFQRLDADNDGFLDIEELKYLLLDMGYTKHDADAEAIKMVHHADLNKDGKVDFEEFKAAWYRKVLSTNDQYINRVFGVFDENGDGNIDAAELQNLLFSKDSDPNAKQSESKENIENKDKDKDKDNTNGFDLLSSVHHIIEEVDQNGDHVISFEEFQKAMKEDIEQGRLKLDTILAGAKIEQNLSKQK